MGMGRAGWESGYFLERPPVTGWFQPQLIDKMALDPMLRIFDDSLDERRQAWLNRKSWVGDDDRSAGH